MVELGVIHSVLISFNDQGATADAADRSTAEGDAPASANRLWDSEQPSDVSYIIASGEQDRQSFQTVSASVRVLFRVGLSDDAGRAALYREADPDALVHVAGRPHARAVLRRPDPAERDGRKSGGDRRRDAATRLQQALDRLDSGVDVVAVIVEAIHPPGRRRVGLSQRSGR